jgi:sugar/nucleoside kinase (ribokinase family)
MPMSSTPSGRRFGVAAAGSWTNFDHVFQVNRLPVPGDTVQILGPIAAVETVTWGGCAPNVAAAAARLDVPTALVSVAGEDFITRGYERHLRDLGVDLTGVIVRDNDRCGHSFLFTDPAGATICLSHLGAAAQQGDYEPAAAVIADAAVAVITYRFDRFTLRAAQAAARSGARVIISGNLTTGPSVATDLIATADILICTDFELRRLLDHLELGSWADLVARGLHGVVVTRGGEGCAVLTAAGEERLAAVPAQVVDPVGAGDAFAGGFAAGLASGRTMTESARLGAVVASIVVEAVGCQTNLPTLGQVFARVPDLAANSE